MQRTSRHSNKSDKEGFVGFSPLSKDRGEPTGLKGWESLHRKIATELAKIDALGRRRSLLDQRLLASALDLTHNDYLGLRQDSAFQTLAKTAAEKLPLGSGASRLLGGNDPIFSQLEDAFASYKGSETSLYFSSGFLANQGLMAAIAQNDVCVYSDALNHASLIDGLRLIKKPSVQKVIFPHRDLHFLEKALKSSRNELNVIVTESVFSMDGDIAPLADLQELAYRYRGVLLVDEAHAIGCHGKGGSGMIHQVGLSHEYLISVNPCGKAMGLQGAFICAPKWFRDYLINAARPFIFSTAPSPFIAAALLQSIEYVQTLDSRREHLQDVAQFFKQELGKKCGATQNSQTHIVPYIVGDENKAVALSERLQECGVFCRAIRPPTVAPGTSRLRFSLHAMVQKEDVLHIIETLQRFL
ncbi:MAG: 8-amino-7-oxononanoate synthase [Bdellovibrionota bacterium]